MSVWILIVLMSSRSTDAGVHSSSVEFSSEEKCVAAAQAIAKAWNEADAGRPKVVAVCAEK